MDNPALLGALVGLCDIYLSRHSLKKTWTTTNWLLIWKSYFFPLPVHVCRRFAASWLTYKHTGRRSVPFWAVWWKVSLVSHCRSCLILSSPCTCAHSFHNEWYHRHLWHLHQADRLTWTDERIHMYADRKCLIGSALMHKNCLEANISGVMRPPDHVYAPIPSLTTDWIQRKKLCFPLIQHGDVTRQEQSSVVFLSQ